MAFYNVQNNKGLPLKIVKNIENTQLYTKNTALTDFLSYLIKKYI